MKIYKRKFYLRKIIPHINKNIIKIITGMRRTGKSVILKQTRDYIIEKENVDIKNTLLIDKDLNEFKTIKDNDDLSVYIENSLKDISGKKYLFIDEVQLIDNWEKTINSYLKLEEYDIYITGSNSSMLSSEISTLVAGRYINIEVSPLSFNEYYEFIGNRFTDTSEAFEYYIRYGGLPYILCYSKEQLEDEIIFQYIKAIYNTVVLKDIIEKYPIRDTAELERISLYLFDNIGNLTTANKISAYLKSLKSGLTVQTVLNYIKYFTDSFLLHKCQRYDIRGKKLLTINSKFYANDIGLINGVLGYSINRIGGMLENLVYMELLRKGYDIKIGYINDKEIDFIAEKRNKKVYIQVTYQLGDPTGSTYQREYAPLLSVKDNYPKYILSTDGKIAGEGEHGINRVNIGEFLLKNEL